MSDSTTTKRTPRARTRPRPTQAAQERLTEAQAILRRELRAAEARKHEDAYFAHVVCPLVMRGFPRPKPQAMLIPGRRYRWDYCYLEARLAIEIQGQIWHKGGHTSGRGLTRDADKLNQLTCIGWRLLIFTPEMIESGEALTVTERALRRAGLKGVA